MRNLVTFRSSAFDTSEEQEEFVNPGNYGRDLAGWIADELAERGVEVDAEPGQEDHGWFVRFRHAGRGHCFVVGHRPGEDDLDPEWVGWVERSVGPLGVLLGRRTRGIDARVLVLLHAVLTSRNDVRNVRWHEERSYERGDEGHGTFDPLAAA